MLGDLKKGDLPVGTIVEGGMQIPEGVFSAGRVIRVIVKYLIF